VSVEEYAGVYRDLINRTRAMAGAANDVDATFYRYLEDLVRPWLDTHVLARAERDILFDLLIRCQHVDAQLGGRSWLGAFGERAAPAYLGALLFSIIVLCVLFRLVELNTILDRAWGWSDDVVFRIVHSTELERLFLVGLVLTAVSIYSISRTAHN
jgi:hypothetical protein